MKNKEQLYLQRIEVNHNFFIAICDRDSLWWLSFDRPDCLWQERFKDDYELIDKKCELHECVKEDLVEYYDDPSHEFNIPLHIEGTEFQVAVLTELQKVKAGETLSYGELAKRVGHPKAYRAVASTMKHNPLAIVIPCHRVNLANDKLSKYNGGIENKLQLLTHEGWGSMEY